MPRRLLPSIAIASLLSPRVAWAQSLRAASKAALSSRLNTRCKVATQGVCPRVKPRVWANPQCSRPHWAIAYKLWQLQSMAHVARVRMAGKGWRLPRGFLGSGTRLKASSKEGPRFSTFCSSMPGFSTSIPTIKRPFPKCNGVYTNFSQRLFMVNPTMFEVSPKEQYDLTRAVLFHEADHPSVHHLYSPSRPCPLRLQRFGRPENRVPDVRRV